MGVAAVAQPCTGITYVAEEAVLCHVAYWLEWPDFNVLHTASRKLCEFIRHRQTLLANWLRGQHSGATVCGRAGASDKGGGHGTRHFCGQPEKMRGSSKCAPLSLAEPWPHHTCGPQHWTITKFLDSFKKGDTLEKLHAKRPKGHKHPRRAAALAHPLGWLDGEELHDP